MSSARQNAVIDGCYADFKLVKTRSVFQMVIEGPIERAAEAIAMFGVPQPGQEIHVAVARLQAPPGPAPAADSGPSTASVPPTTGAVPGRDTGKSERAKANFAALPDMKKDVVKAALMTKDVTFQGWIACGDFDPKAPAADRERHADSCMKAELHIESKAEIGESREVNERWHTLLTTYLADTNQMAEVRG